jgi:hypothetical protein
MVMPSDARAADGDEGELGGNEEAVGQDQGKHGDEPQGNDPGIGHGSAPCRFMVATGHRPLAIWRFASAAHAVLRLP